MSDSNTSIERVMFWASALKRHPIWIVALAAVGRALAQKNQGVCLCYRRAWCDGSTE